jgi:hypothetical protein
MHNITHRTQAHDQDSFKLWNVSRVRQDFLGESRELMISLVE